MKHKNFRHRIIFPVGISLIIILSAGVFSIHKNMKTSIDDELRIHLKGVQDFFKHMLLHESDIIKGVGRSLRGNRQLQDAFINRDRVKLLNVSSTIFKMLKAEHNITHFYFHKLDKICYLRVHKPKHFGDAILRFTLKAASETVDISSGIELGPYGTLTLRVVFPWHINGKLAGFIELGKDVEHLSRLLQRVLGLDIIFIINKNNINRSKWEEGLKFTDKPGEWNNYKEYVIINSTIKKTKKKTKNLLNNFKNWTGFYPSDDFFTAKSGEVIYRGGSIPLIDVGGHSLGRILVLEEIAKKMSNIFIISLSIVSAAVLLYLVLLLFFWVYLGRMEKSLNAAHKDLKNTITYLENVEKVLLEKDRRLSSFMGSATDGFILYDSDLNILDINNAAMRLFPADMDKEALTGKNYIESKPLFMDFIGVNRLHNVLKTGNPYFANDVLIKSGSKDLYYSIKIFKAGSGIGIITADITNRIETEKKLRLLVSETDRARQEAEQANRAKSMFLAVMSHEIRTPINAIMGMTDLVKMTNDKNEKEEYLNTVSDAADHLLTVINDILDISKIEANRMELNISDFEIFKTMDVVFNTFRYKAEKNGLYFELDVDDRIPIVVRGDETRLRQILINIIGNAVKFTGKGGIKIDAALYTEYNSGIEKSEDKVFIQFTISDTGIGIPDDKLNEIFISFTQAEGSIARKYGGTGLGLTICKQLAELMNGKIDVSSKFGDGSTFKLLIPFATGNIDNIDKETVMGVSEKVIHRKLKILLAEDNKVNIKLLTVFLNKMEHDVDVAETGYGVLNMLKENTYNLILMDVEMPEMTGIEAARLIRKGEAGEENRDVPIIALTAHVVDEIREDCKKAGMDYFISKPVKIKELGRIIDNVISSK